MVIRRGRYLLSCLSSTLLLGVGSERLFRRYPRLGVLQRQTECIAMAGDGWDSPLWGDGRGSCRRIFVAPCIEADAVKSCRRQRGMIETGSRECSFRYSSCTMMTCLFDQTTCYWYLPLITAPFSRLSEYQSRDHACPSAYFAFDNRTWSRCNQ